MKEQIGLYNERFNMSNLSPEALDITKQETLIPTEVHMDSSLRVKVTDNCGMTCVFCHNEGTPVANTSQVARGRVSIFENYNGVYFSPGQMIPNDQFVQSLTVMRDLLGSNELHWTGGEPSNNLFLPELTAIATDLGYQVKMTSNGETGGKKMEQYAKAGLKGVNFSIFGTTPAELALVQADRYNNVKLAEIKLRNLDEAICAASDAGINVKANIVMANKSHCERVGRVLEKYGLRLTLRILDSLDDGIESPQAIYEFLAQVGATPYRRVITAGASGSRVDYNLPDGNKIGFKQIRTTRLPDTCSTCSMNNDEDCKEGYYGVRLYIDDAGDYHVGVCLQRMDLALPLQEFVESSLPDEIKDFRKHEYTLLQQSVQNS